MAKSSSFFGLRKGSTKSHTYQVLRGEQITKDRVVDVSNPQSNLQMQQRLKMPLISNARSVLSTLVNHSFEGVEYGYKSLHEFSSQNMKKGALTISSYVPHGIMDCGQADFIISKGSLPSVNIDASKSDSSNVEISTYTKFIQAELPTAGSSLTAAQIQAILTANQVAGLEEADQLTFLAAYNSGEYNFTASDGTTKTGNYHHFVVSRLILDSSDLSQSSQWTWKDNGVLSDNYVDIDIAAAATGNLSFSLTDHTDTLCMACCILSRKQTNNNYRRSSQRMVIISKDGITYDDVISGYLKSGTNSSRYLNSGVEGVDITGGNA